MVDGRLTSETRRFDGDRAAVRQVTVAHAFEGLLLRLAQAGH
jgi:nicotinamide-nucleotide amidase